MCVCVCVCVCVFVFVCVCMVEGAGAAVLKLLAAYVSIRQHTLDMLMLAMFARITLALFALMLTMVARKDKPLVVFCW